MGGCFATVVCARRDAVDGRVDLIGWQGSLPFQRLETHFSTRSMPPLSVHSAARSILSTRGGFCDTPALEATLLMTRSLRLGFNSQERWNGVGWRFFFGFIYSHP